MSYFRVNYSDDGEAHTVIIEAINIDTAMFNATSVLTYPHADLVGTVDEATPATDIKVFPALPGEEDEYDHIHSSVEDMERVIAEVKAAVAAKRGRK